MRSLTTIVVLGLALLSPALPAGAATPGFVCRNACGPRVLEQCGTVDGRAPRRCRRQLIRACKAATPETACQTTADLTRTLGDHFLTIADESRIVLCADGRYAIKSRPDSGLPRRDRGDWTVQLIDGGLALVLDGRRDDSALPLQPDGNGGVAVNGAAAVVTDAASDCTPPPPPPPADPRDPARVLAVARALTDRIVKRIGVDQDGRPELQGMLLCSSGGTRTGVDSAAGFVRDRGTWDIDATGTSMTLSLEQNSIPNPIPVSVLEDGTILFDGEPAIEVRDGRDPCVDVDLEVRLRALLVGKVYVFDTSTPGSPFNLQSTLAFCSPDGFGRRAALGLPTRGTWEMEVVDGTAVISLIDPTTGAQTALPLAQAPDGTLLVDGLAPVDDPSLALRSIC